MSKRVIIYVNNIDDLENYISSDTHFYVRVVKQGLCIVTRLFAIIWRGNEQELIDYLEDNLFDIY
jgi:hypothetical protein